MPRDGDIKTPVGGPQTEDSRLVLVLASPAGALVLGRSRLLCGELIPVDPGVET